MLLIALGEICYLHLAAIMLRSVGFSTQLLIDALIIVCIIILTRIRLSETEQEKAESEKEKKYIVED